MQPEITESLIILFAWIGLLCAFLAPLAWLADWLEARANRRIYKRAKHIQAHNPFLRRQAE